MRKKLTNTIAVIVLIAYATLWAVYWIMVYNDVEPWVRRAIEITRTVALCSMYGVVLFNALGWTGNPILRIVFIAFTAFLITSAIAGYIPSVEEFFAKRRIPLMR